MGATDPAKAAAGTIRKLHANSIGENSVHGSDAADTAAIEIAQNRGTVSTVKDRVALNSTKSNVGNVPREQAAAMRASSCPSAAMRDRRYRPSELKARFQQAANTPSSRTFWTVIRRARNSPRPRGS